MKFQSSNTKVIHEFDFDLTKRKRYSCPECSKDSKRKSPKDLEFYPDTKISYCHKCETTYFEYKPYENKKEFVIPEWKNKTDLSDKAVKYFNSRMISQETLVKMKVYTDIEYMPQFQKEVETMCFPYFVDGVLKNTKFRGGNKSFKLVSGAELIWYNFNALKDNKDIIICEGEMDALTWIECGFNNVISVPNGASAKTMEYLDSSIKLFDNIEKVYLSTDNDSKGLELRDELIIRLGAEKCYTLQYKQYKDINDYFCGGNEVKEVINTAKPIPISGLVEVDSFYNEILDLYENGETKGLEIGNEEIDKYITWELGRLVTVTGIPSSGKSEVVDYIVARLNLLYGWKAAYFTPENYPLKYHYRKIHTKISGQNFDKNKDNTDFFNIYEHVKGNYSYIMNEDDMTVDSVMKSAKALVKQKGIKILVIDPYNKLEHPNGSNTSETQYISKFLDIITNFARFNNVLVFLVAHPRKVPKGETPTLYDIAGSANFYNKTDYGFTVERTRDIETGAMNTGVDIHWQKIKFRHLGEQGISSLNFNINNGRYNINGFDNTNWMVKDPIQISMPEIDIEELNDHFNQESREPVF